MLNSFFYRKCIPSKARDHRKRKGVSQKKMNEGVEIGQVHVTLDDSVMSRNLQVYERIAKGFTNNFIREGINRLRVQSMTKMLRYNPPKASSP